MTFRIVDRQWPLVAVARFTLDDLAAATAVDVIELPGNAVVIGGQILVTTAFDDTSSDDTIEVGDADDADRFGVIGVSALGSEPLTIDNDNAQYSVPTSLTLTRQDGTTGDASVGEGLLIVQYVVEGRGNEVH
tara:strand:+ start:745 stop:1143 length:399 start_codon:yes stop_codon:yes gene_type:complete